MAKYDYFEDEYKKTEPPALKRAKKLARVVPAFFEAAAQTVRGEKSAPAQKEKQKKAQKAPSRPAGAASEARRQKADAPQPESSGFALSDGLAPPQPSAFGGHAPIAPPDFTDDTLAPPAPEFSPAPAPPVSKKQKAAAPPGKEKGKKTRAPKAHAARPQSEQTPAEPAPFDLAPPQTLAQMRARSRSDTVHRQTAPPAASEAHTSVMDRIRLPRAEKGQKAAKENRPEKTAKAQKAAPKNKAPAVPVHKYPSDLFDPIGGELAPPAAALSSAPVLPDLPARRPPRAETPAPEKAGAAVKDRPQETSKKQKKAEKAHKAAKAQPQKTAAPPAKITGPFAAQRSRARQKADARRAREARLAAIENRLQRENAGRPAAVRAAAAEAPADPAVLKAQKAATHIVRIVLIVFSCLAVLAAVGVILGFSLTISSEARRSSAFAQNSAVVCAQYLADYGEGDFVDSSEETYDLYSMTGFFSARRLDFDGDGHEELLVLYNDEGTYAGDVWGLNEDGDFAKLYTAPFSSDAQTGETWLVLFKTGSKYYLGTQSGSRESDITFYRLKGDTFVKASGTGVYNSEKKTYRRLGRNITGRLEFLKVTMLTQRQSEVMLSDLQQLVDSFGTASGANADLTESQQRAQAYLDVINDVTIRYGAGALSDDAQQLDGLAVVRLVDFNGDGADELLLAYKRTVAEVDTSSGDASGTTTKYVMEVYQCTGSAATLIFTNETLVTPSFDADARLLMLHQADSEVRICTVTREVNSSASGRYTARVYRMGDDTFDLLFSAEVEDTYGTKRYTIDGEQVDAEQFSENGMGVPYFYRNDDKPDDSYTVIYLAASDSENELRAALNDTNDTIDRLNAALDG